MKISRVVVDTNVILSAMLSEHGASFAVYLEIAENGQLLFSEETYAEIVTRLQRPKFDKWVSLEDRLKFLQNLHTAIEWVEITGDLTASRDPEDDMSLETALVGNADAIVTGDKDLLVLHPFENIPIYRPAEWLALQSSK